MQTPLIHPQYKDHSDSCSPLYNSGSSPRPASASPRLNPAARAINKSPQPHASRGKEWWEVPNVVPRYEDLGPKTFAFDLPEHLPNSPMCPANKKHKSGGTGVCVYHGRRKRSSSDQPSSGTVGVHEQNVGVIRAGPGHGEQFDRIRRHRKLEDVLGRIELKN